MGGEMKRWLRKPFGFAGRRCLAIADWIYEPTQRACSNCVSEVQQRALAAWHDVDGDKTCRLNYDLDDSSIVLDVGGYEGQWCSEIFSRYLCQVHVFEPVPEFSASIAARFARNDRVTVHEFGLAGRTRSAVIGIDRDSSSIVRAGNLSTEIRLVRAVDFLSGAGFSQVDLMKINIEGAEYELLEDLIGDGWIKQILDLQVQFHQFVPNAADRMHRIQRELARTHSLTFQYPFVWENWRRKDDCNDERIPA